jgi:hypothetical protein
MDVLFEAPHGADGNDSLDTERLQGVDVGPSGQFAGADVMPLPVPGEEGNWYALKSAGDDQIAGLAERGLHLGLFEVAQSIDLVETAASDDSDLSFDHEGLLCYSWSDGFQRA